MRTLKISLLIFIFLISISAQNFWQQANGPYAVPNVYDFFRYNDTIIFLGTNEGVFESKDNGETWARIEGQDLYGYIRGFAKDHFGTLYAGRYNTEHGFKRLLKSADEGNTWNQTSFGAEIRCIFIPYKDTIMVGSWDKGVYRSFDGGTTWSRVNNGNIYNGIYEIIQLDDGSVLAGSAGGGVFKTTNWGDLWIPSNTGIPPNSQGYRFAKTFLKTAPDCLLVGTHTGIYCSTNNGESWSFKSEGLADKEINKIVKDENGILYAGVDLGNGVYYSTNSGDYWYHLGLNISTTTLGWDSDSRFYAGGLLAGLYRYAVGDSSWKHIIDHGYNPLDINHLWITDSGNLIARSGELSYTTNSGIKWKTLYVPEGFYDIGTINDSIFIGGSLDHIWVSNDTGKVWTATADFGSLSIYYESVSQTVFLGTKIYGPDSCNIYRSNDFGQNWEIIYRFPHLSQYQVIKPMIVTKTNHVFLVNIIYSSQIGGSTSKFYRSIDFGQTWEIIMEEEDFTNLLEDDSSNLYALHGIKFYISEDEGKTWFLRNNPGTTCIALDENGRLFSFNSNNVWYSVDKGNTWTEVDNSGLNNVVIKYAVIDHLNKIYLGTDQGVYYGEADSIVVSVENIGPAKTFYLSQNYPNPFNPTTKIKFTIPQTDNPHPGGARGGLVTLKVYDVLGNEVETLVDEEKPIGSYEVEFNASGLTSGIYFYRLQAGSFVATKKMILLK